MVLCIMAIMSIMVAMTWYKSNFIEYRLQVLWIKFRTGLKAIRAINKVLRWLDQ